MLVRKIDSPDTISLACEVLSRGGIIAHPTESCYGLAADFSIPAAVEKVFALKHRPFDKKLLIIFSEWSQVQDLVSLTPNAKKLAKKFWPGPLTLVLPAIGGGTLAVRHTAHPFCRSLLQKYGKALVSTSANFSGEPNPYSAAMVEGLAPDFLVDGGVLLPVAPSTIVDCTSVCPRILRLGDIQEKELLPYLECSGRDS